MVTKEDDADGFLESRDAAEQEKTLIASAGTNKTAFERLMKPHLPVVYQYLKAHAPNEADAEDILQETMLSCWKSISAFQGTSGFRTWLMGIARHKLADYYRDQYGRNYFSTVDLFDPELPDTADGQAERKIEQVSEAIDIERAKEGLSAQDKELLFLVFDAQLSYTEIETVTGIPSGTVKSRIYTIKGKLRPLLAEGRADK